MKKEKYLDLVKLITFSFQKEFEFHYDSKFIR